MLGLLLYTFSVVTYWLPLGELGMIVAMLGLAMQPNRLIFPRPIMLFCAFLVWSAISVAFSSYSDANVLKLVEVLKLLIVAFVVVNALRTPNQVKYFHFFFLLCFMLFPVRGTFVGGDSIFGGRVVWNYIYANPNDLAALSLLTLGLAVGFVYSRNSHLLLRLFAALSAVLLVIVIFRTQSRGVAIGLALGIGVPLILAEIRRPARLIAVSTIVVLAVLETVPTSVWERLAGMEKLGSISTAAEAEVDSSALERLEIKAVALRIIGDHPAFGVGLGAYRQANAKYAPHLGMRDAHNTYLSLIAEVGFMGLAIWVAMFFSVLRGITSVGVESGNSDVVIRAAWLRNAFLGYLVAGIFGSYHLLSFSYLMLGVLWCSKSSFLRARSEHAPVHV